MFIIYWNDKVQDKVTPFMYLGQIEWIESMVWICETECTVYCMNHKALERNIGIFFLIVLSMCICLFCT